MRGFLPAFVIFNNYAVSSYRVLLNFSKKIESYHLRTADYIIQ